MKTLIRSDSDVFNAWSDKVHKILNQLPMITANGHMPLEYSDEEYQQCMKKLQQCAMRFEDLPIYPINEETARRLIDDQLVGLNDKPDY
jgi:hypothetical protein